MSAQAGDSNAVELIDNLRSHGLTVVLGMNVFYEMVKTFGMRSAEEFERGSALFSYLERWINLGILVMRQTPEILVQEVLHCEGESKRIETSVDLVEYRQLSAEIHSLATGQFGLPAKQFIDVRKATAKDVRSEMAAHLNARPELQSMLRGIERSQLPEWIGSEVTSVRGVDLLSRHILHVLPQCPVDTAMRVAAKLLRLDEYRIARGLVRSGIYQNWRLANRQSLRSDVPDDAYHVVSASYSSFFVTTDYDQGDQVRHAIPSLPVLSYDRTVPLRHWLPSTVTNFQTART